MRNVSGMVSRGAATTHCYVTTVTLHARKKIVPPLFLVSEFGPPLWNMLSSLGTKGEKRKGARQG